MKSSVKIGMDTDETFLQSARRILGDLIASLSVAFLPAVGVGLAACFVVELYMHQSWEGMWPPLSWSTSVLSFVVFFVFGFETPQGRQFCNRIVWGNKFMRSIAALFG